MAGKKPFCKLDFSQAYHCLQMADQQSIEMLAFYFASCTFEYRRLEQNLSRAMSTFSSFMREYLDKVIEADQCALYVDDIGIAANDADHLIANLRATFKGIQEAGLKLTMPKSLLVLQKIISSDESLPHKAYNQRNKMYKTFLKRPIYRSRKRLYCFIWVFLITFKKMSQDCPRKTLGIFSGVRLNRSLSSQTIEPLPYFFKRKSYLQPCGKLVTT